MIKNLSELQRKSKYALFAMRLTEVLCSKNIAPTPIAFVTAFNRDHQSTSLKPHTVRKWLLGTTQPRSETLLLLVKWLEISPESLFVNADLSTEHRSGIEFDFMDQKVISKYLSMNFKQKTAVSLMIDTILDKSE